MPDQAGIKTCPQCKLLNPPEAERCDCGWDFLTSRQERSYLPRKALNVTAGIGAGAVVVIILIKLGALLLKASMNHF